MDIKRLLIMVVLVGALGWAVTTSPLTKRFFGGTAKRPAPVGALAPITEEPSGAPAGTAPRPPAPPLTREQVGQWRRQHDTAWRRDPFFTAPEEIALFGPKAATAGPPPPPPPAYKVRAIFISEAGKLAALDGSLVAEGEAIGDERVIEIRPDAVLLERNGERRRIVLPGGTTPVTEADSRSTAGRGR